MGEQSLLAARAALEVTVPPSENSPLEFFPESTRSKRSDCSAKRCAIKSATSAAAQPEHSVARACEVRWQLSGPRCKTRIQKYEASPFNPSVRWSRAWHNEGDSQAAGPVVEELRRLSANGSESDRLVASGVLLQIGQSHSGSRLSFAAVFHRKTRISDGWPSSLAMQTEQPWFPH